MRNNFKTVLTTTAVLAALASGSVLYAYADSPNSPSSDGMMQGGQGGMPNMMGMMNMMGQMSRMMETRNNMMKELPQHPGPEKSEQSNKLE